MNRPLNINIYFLGFNLVTLQQMFLYYTASFISVNLPSYTLYKTIILNNYSVFKTPSKKS